MSARLLLAASIVAICFTSLPLARAQQVSPPAWTPTQPSVSSHSYPFTDKSKLDTEYEDGYDGYETADSSETIEDTPSAWQRFWSKFCLESRRNNAWPYPFLYADRVAVRAPFVVMVNNGWRRQNTLGAHHFREDSSDLTEAGEIKVRWILLEGPVHHQTIYVHAARTAEETAKRVDAVQQLAIKLVPTGALPAVLQTNIPPAGWPAGHIDDINRKFQSSMPEPRLKEDSSDSGDINQ